MKKHVGRPSNQELNVRRNKKIFIIAIVAVLVFVVVLLFETGALSSLMGNSVTGGNYRTVREKAYKIGDINKDDSINVDDFTLLEKYNRGTEQFDDYQKLLADVNKDGNIDVVDKTILSKYISDYSTGTIGATHYIGQNICPDGKSGRSYCTRKELIEDVLYGDVNSDGRVDITDKTYLSGYVAKKTNFSLTEKGKKAADVNADGIIDISDETILDLYLKGTITELPYK